MIQLEPTILTCYFSLIVLDEKKDSFICKVAVGPIPVFESVSPRTLKKIETQNLLLHYRIGIPRTENPYWAHTLRQ